MPTPTTGDIARHTINRQPNRAATQTLDISADLSEPSIGTQLNPRPDGPTAGRFSFLGHGMATELKCCSCDDDLDLIELVVEPDAEPIVICKGCVEDMFNRVFAAPAVH